MHHTVWGWDKGSYMYWLIDWNTLNTVPQLHSGFAPHWQRIWFLVPTTPIKVYPLHLLNTSSLVFTFTNASAPSFNWSKEHSSVVNQVYWIPSNRSLYPGQANKCTSLSMLLQNVHTSPHLPLKLLFVGNIRHRNMNTMRANWNGNCSKYHRGFITNWKLHRRMSVFDASHNVL